MAGVQAKSLDKPDETRSADKTAIDVVDLGDATAARLTLQPGWKWSECIKPVVGTERCQAAHLGYVVSGRLHVLHNDGMEGEVGPGYAYRIEPGHDAWVIGDEPLVALEFESATAQTYARS
jgi:hypothetical protein